LVGSLVLVATGSTVTPELRERSIVGYQVVYRIEDRAKPSRVDVSTEVLEVRRPYGGRVEVRDRDGRVRSGRITSREHLWVLGRNGQLRFGVLRPPGPPARDASLAALRDASRAGQARSTGSGTVAGRMCAWFSYRKPFPDALATPTKKERIESCVDASGIVLREVWTIGGRSVRLIEAVRVSEAVPSGSRLLEGKNPATEKVSEPEAAGLVRTGTLVADVVRDRERTPLKIEQPEGWKADRASVVAISAGEGRPTQFLSETFLKDRQLTIVEIGSSAQLAPPWGTDEGERIRLKSGEGRILYFTDRVEIRLLSAIGFARVVAPSREIALDFVNGLTPAR
jgi:hypothetical protein